MSSVLGQLRLSFEAEKAEINVEKEVSALRERSRNFSSERTINNHIIFFSGGKASFAVADWVKMNYPNDNIILYFTDTLWENEDTYRFINEGSDVLQLPLLTHSSGLNPLQLMFEKKLVYNSMIGDCSKLLKIKVGSDFLKKGIKPKIEKWRNQEYLRQEDFIKGATLYFGIGFDEMHRQDSIISNWDPFTVDMPLINNNIWVKEVLKKHNIKAPIMYDLGFSHNNCNARCVKAGKTHFKNFKAQLPREFQKFMEQEFHLKMCVSAYRYIIDDKVPEDDRIPDHVQEKMLEELDDAYRDYFYDRAEKPKLYIHPAGSASCKYMKIKQYSFMKRGGEEPVVKLRTLPNGEEIEYIDYPSVPYPLRELHNEIENDQQIDMFDIGGCGCFVTF